MQAPGGVAHGRSTGPRGPPTIQPLQRPNALARSLLRVSRLSAQVASDASGGKVQQKGSWETKVFFFNGTFVRRGLFLLVGLACVLVVGCGAPSSTDEVVQGDQSLLSGAHFSLNLIGVPKSKTADMTGNSGHRIFVPLEGRTQILLSQGDFQVLDANGTDGSAAFRLPNPDPDNDGVTSYSVFARALGKPGGSSKTTTCATDPVSGELFCSIYSMVLVREKGKSSFTNVSRELLYVFADLDGDGTVERTPLFGDGLVDFFWEYDNSGLKLAQLRFYEIPTNVN